LEIQARLQAATEEYITARLEAVQPVSKPAICNKRQTPWPEGFALSQDDVEYATANDWQRSDMPGMLRRFGNRARNRGDKVGRLACGLETLEHSYRPPASQQKRRVPDV
jgi:hypothetical protein